MNSSSYDMQVAIMSVVEWLCTGDTGYSTSAIARFIGRQPGHDSDRKHSALILRELRALEKAGRVHRLDDKLPIVWCRS